MNTWSYVLLERDAEGTIVGSVDVTEEIVSLYTRIDLLEGCNDSWRKDFFARLQPMTNSKH